MTSVYLKNSFLVIYQLRENYIKKYCTSEMEMAIPEVVVGGVVVVDLWPARLRACFVVDSGRRRMIASQWQSHVILLLFPV